MTEASATPTPVKATLSSTDQDAITRINRLINVLNGTSTVLQMHVDTLRLQNINPNLTSVWLRESIPALVNDRVSEAIEELITGAK